MFLSDNQVATIEEIVKAKASKLGLTIKKVAEEAKISEPTLYDIFRRNDAKASQLKNIAEVLKTSLAELLGEDALEEEGEYYLGNVASVTPNMKELYVQVPFLSARAQAGIPELTFENCHLHLDETYPVFLPNVIITKRHLVIEIIGESMLPEIKNGAIVLTEQIKKEDIKYESGGIYAVIYANRLVVKRIRTNELNINGTLTLWSDNETYGRIVVNGEDIQCMWKVISKVYEPVR